MVTPIRLKSYSMFKLVMYSGLNGERADTGSPYYLTLKGKA